MESSTSSEFARKFTVIALIGAITTGVCAETIRNHLDNRIYVSQGKSCAGTFEVMAHGDTLENIAKTRAHEIGVPEQQAMYLAEFIVRANPRESFSPTPDGQQKIVSQTVTAPTSCEF